MATKRMSVEDLLSEQSNSGLRATVEAIEGKDDLVKVTPWVGPSGCLCHLAIEVRKSSLEGVSPTGDTHVCCGKRLKVVELHFKKTDTMTIEELFQQIHANALKLTTPGSYAHPSAAGGAYGYGLSPSMMQLIQGPGHAEERAPSSWIPTLTPASPPLGALNPRFVDCAAKWLTCISSVNPFTDQRTQYCKCRNDMTICMREGILELCTAPRY